MPSVNRSLLRRRRAIAKQTVLDFVAARLDGDGRRCNANVELLNGMALDFDSGRTT